MAYWNNNFACPPPNFTGNDNQSPRPFQNRPPLPPMFPPQTQFYPPPDPSQPQFSIPSPSMMAPPPFYTALPPPPLTSMPPPNVSSTLRPPIAQNDPEDKFEQLKAQMEGRYRQIETAKKSTVHMKVSDIKEMMVKSFHYLEELESLMNCLQFTYKSLPENEWLGHCTDVEKIKGDLSASMKEINNPDKLEIMRKVVQSRKKKRDYKKRKQKEWREQKQVAKIHADQEGRRIDLWLEKMKDQVARAKREEDIKREADAVLSDVTSMKAEAKRMLNMLNSLAKLRAARANNLPSGKYVPDCDNKAFNEIIDRLRKMWVDQLNVYKVEEDGLKVMLGHAEEERISVEAAQLRKNLKAWYQVIFGPSSSVPILNVDELIRTRYDWDMFMCTDDVPMASSIPIGWVLPCEPSSRDWEALL